MSAAKRLTLTEICEQQAQFVRNSNVIVEVDERMPTVDIHEEGDPENGVFLQGDDAENFVREFRRTWHEAQTLGLDDAIYAQAHQYLDLLQ